MNHCQCGICKLNGYQGRLFIEYSGQRYCTAHPQYMHIKRYKQALVALHISPERQAKIETKPLVLTPPPRKKPELHMYVLSFRDCRGVEQDWFIKSECDEDAANQAHHFLKCLRGRVMESTLVREHTVKYFDLLMNR